MARLTLFCMVALAVVALTCAQLSGQGMGPLGNSGGGMNNGGQTGMMSNPWQAIMMSRFLDMNPFYAMLLGGFGGMNSGFLWPMLWARNW